MNVDELLAEASAILERNGTTGERYNILVPKIALAQAKKDGATWDKEGNTHYIMTDNIDTHPNRIYLPENCVVLDTVAGHTNEQMKQLTELLINSFGAFNRTDSEGNWQTYVHVNETNAEAVAVLIEKGVLK